MKFTCPCLRSDNCGNISYVSGLSEIYWIILKLTDYPSECELLDEFNEFQLFLSLPFVLFKDWCTNTEFL